ncbi:hypothetical protein [Sneathiella limimaris]|uniref:hypothetical protein n=1 Tax=Sneathiella limimaris TaxID=1964213 RepID=UPI00146E58F4|nr:hypothetical protein [Sneathiella limimaris]
MASTGFGPGLTRHLLGCFLILSLLGACEAPKRAASPQPMTAQFDAPAGSDPELVWQAARVALPVRGSTSSLVTTMGAGVSPLVMAGGSPGTRWPVLLMLEGCSTPAPPRLLKALAEQGYVALSLSSEARRHEPLACDPQKTLLENAAAIQSQKGAELTFALHALDRLNWVDPDHVFVLGFFEAGAAVARMKPAKTAGRVLIGWDCQGLSTGGLRDTALSPVFSVSMMLAAAGRDCSGDMADNTENRFLRLSESYSLNVLLEPIVFTQMLQFLDRRLFR